MTASAPASSGISASWPRQAARFMVTIGLTILVFVLLVRYINGGQTLQLLRHLKAGYLAPMLAVSLSGNILVGSDKFIRILRTIKHRLRFSESVFIRLGAAPIKFILPAKAGEMVKAIYLQRRTGIPFTEGVSALIFDKITNLLGILLFFVPGVLVASIPYGYKILLAGGGVAAALVLRYGSAKLMAWVARPGFPWQTTAMGLLRCFHDIGKRKQLLFVAYSVVFVGTEVFSSWCSLRALDITVPMSLFWLSIPLIILVGNLPVTISGLGTREAAFVVLFTGYGSSEALFAAGILVSLVEYVLLPAIGLFFMPVFLLRTLSRKSGA